MAGLLDHVVVGFERIEPVIVANVALGKNFILIGRHGTCMTTLAKILAGGCGGSSVVYDATKDDILSICGIPKTAALEEGRFEFATGERTIWGKQFIVIDELGRATKENQNILLEILQERTCFGQKLDYRVVIATMNPETYSASLRLDEALLDRFYAVLPVPDFATGVRKDTVLKILHMNFSQEREESAPDFKGVFQEIDGHYRGLLAATPIRDAVLEYTSAMMEMIKGRTDAYISNRKAVQLAEEICAVAAYFEVRHEGKRLSDAARLALEYTISRPAGIEMKTILQCHKSLKGILDSYTLDDAGLLRYEFARIPESDVDLRIRFVFDNLKDIAEHLKEDEGNFMMGYVLDHLGDTASAGSGLREFVSGLDQIGRYEEIKRKAQGYLTEFLLKRKRHLKEKLLLKKVVSPEDVERVKCISQMLDESNPETSKKVRDFLLTDSFFAMVEQMKPADILNHMTGIYDGRTSSTTL